MTDIAPEFAAVRPGEDLDWPGIDRYLRAEIPDVLDGAGELEVLQFPNGSANLTYLLRYGDLELVLRRPPFGTIAPGAHDMRREHRVLSRLWKHFDKAPRAYAFCDDHAVAGADFFVMERREGEVIRTAMPPSMADIPDVGRRTGLALVDAMAEMHLLEPAACDLGDLGKAEGFVARQVRGWKHRWDLCKGDTPLPLMDDLAARLEASMPPQTPTVAFVHNDLKMDNCQFDPANPDRVHAIFDWDMTTIGDPLIDLGTLLNYWPDPSDEPGSRRLNVEELGRLGLPTRAEVVARYGERTGFDVSQAAWYEAFAHWKTAVVVRQLHKRWLDGDSHNPKMETIADSIPQLAAAADGLLRGLGV
jgi:aminoglycoside phosphotransferase (APT) family kinase protein